LKAEKIDALNWDLSLSGKNLAKDVYIDCDFEADISDNYFDLLTNEPVKIKIKTQSPVNEIISKIKILSVNSIIAKKH
jgi:hypothetical protein